MLQELLSVELIKVVVPVFKLDSAKESVDNHVFVAQMPEYIDVVDNTASMVDVVGAAAITVKVVKVIDNVNHHNNINNPVSISVIQSLNISVQPEARRTVCVLATN